MAVPTIGARIIFEHILKTFAQVPYEVSDTEYQLVDNPDIQQEIKIILPSSKLLRKQIIELTLSRPKFSYSESENIYIQKRERNKIYFSCRRTKYDIEIGAIVKAADLFLQQEIISERNLQLILPTDFLPETYGAFVAIAFLDKLKIGKMRRPYVKTGMWALVPIVENQE